MRFYWNTYRPLCMTADGRRASEIFGIPPFVDGSCRREPDLEHAWPAISALCRARAFAPRLRVGDVVVYATTRASDLDGGWRVTGVLQVAAAFDDHAQGAAWYLRQGLPLPSNCLVEGNPPRGLSETAEPRRDLLAWDDGYRSTVARYGAFHVCKPLFVELFDPPRVSKRIAMAAFGRLPTSRTPLDWGREAVMHLLSMIGVDVTILGDKALGRATDVSHLPAVELPAPLAPSTALAACPHDAPHDAPARDARSLAPPRC